MEDPKARLAVARRVHEHVVRLWSIRATESATVTGSSLGAFLQGDHEFGRCCELHAGPVLFEARRRPGVHHCPGSHRLSTSLGETFNRGLTSRYRHVRHTVDFLAQNFLICHEPRTPSRRSRFRERKAETCSRARSPILYSTHARTSSDSIHAIRCGWNNRVRSRPHESLSVPTLLCFVLGRFSSGNRFPSSRSSRSLLQEMSPSERDATPRPIVGTPRDLGASQR